MRKTLGALALLLLLAMGVMVNSLRPAPNLKAREAVGEQGFILNTHAGGPASQMSTYYENGDRPDIVLFPSAGREASDFNEIVMQIIKTGYATQAIEPHGISSAHIEDPLLKKYADQIRPTLSSIPEKPVVLIGHAFGNRVVRMAAHQNSENVKGVILLAAGGQVPMSPKAEQSLKNIFNPLKTYRSRMKDIRYAFFAEGNEIPDYWTRGWYTKTAMAQAKAVAANAGDESWHCAGGVPMLIIQPMQDRIAPPENAYALQDKCPQEVEIIEVQNAGHALLPEQPEAVAKAVLDFLAKHHPTDQNQ